MPGAPDIKIADLNTYLRREATAYAAIPARGMGGTALAVGCPHDVPSVGPWSPVH